MFVFLSRISVPFLRNYNRLCDTTVGYSNSRVYSLWMRFKKDGNDSKTEKRVELEDEDEYYDDKPIKYTTSAAHKKRKTSEFIEVDSRFPGYTAHICIISFVAIFVWFRYLREPNDFDENMLRPMHEHFIGHPLEKQILEMDIRKRKKVNWDTTELEKKYEALIERERIQKLKSNENTAK